MPINLCIKTQKPIAKIKHHKKKYISMNIVTFRNTKRI